MLAPQGQKTQAWQPVRLDVERHMSAPSQAQIARCEEQLLTAMLESDTEQLDALLADELVFTNHMGQVLGKADDLEAHRSGVVVIEAITSSEERILLLDGSAVVSVRTEIAGTFGDVKATSVLRFTRVWRPSADGRWQVVVGQSTLVSDA